MLEDMLTQAGFRVLTATDGAEALRLLASERPDLIVLDLILPWVNGVEVLRTVRDHPQLRIVPVLVVTGTQTSEFELRTFRPVRVLRKPLNVDAVVPTIQQMLSQPSAFQS
jgi:CheY-like chemotaxis protein